MKLTRNTSKDNKLTGIVIGEAIEVHRQLGPGQLESAYEEALHKRLSKIGVSSQRQVPLPLTYKGMRLDCGYRIDLLVEDSLPVELKVVAQILGIHEAQLMTYMRTGRFPLGLLINFQVAVLKQGVVRKTETREWCPDDSDKHTVSSTRWDELSFAVIEAAMEVHQQIGPGLLPSAYLACLCHEFSSARWPLRRNPGSLCCLMVSRLLARPRCRCSLGVNCRSFRSASATSPRCIRPPPWRDSVREGGSGGSS